MSAFASAPRLAAFVRDAFRYAASTSDAAARRLIASPYSGVPRSDARASIVVAGERGSLREAIASGKLQVEREASAALARFGGALDGIALAYRAQGSTPGEVLTAIRAAFALDKGASEPERATLDLLERAVAEFPVAGDAADWAADVADALVRAFPDLPPARELPAQPLGRRERETPQPVARRARVFSASSLGAYAACERRWYYRYVCSAVEDRGSAASFYGSAFHWALEQFHREFPRGDSAPPETLANRLDGWIGTAFERYRSGFATNVEYELQTRRARRTARRYLDWFLERSRAHPFTVIDAEAKIELELGGYDFTGYIDRLDRDDATGAVTVVDYKTGSIAESAAEYREDLERLIDFQLPFYYWARTAHGDRVTRLALVPLKDAFRDVRPIELEVVPIRAPASREREAPTGIIGIDELERARARMIELAQRLSDEPIENFRVTDDPEACVFCAYQIACRSRPMRRENRYAG
jgi:RecB family exonuclease